MIRWLKHSLIALDQLANAALLFGYPDETISSRAYREEWRIYPLIDALFFWDRDHCKSSLESEKQSLHLPEDAR